MICLVNYNRKHKSKLIRTVACPVFVGSDSDNTKEVLSTTIKQMASAFASILRPFDTTTLCSAEQNLKHRFEDLISYKNLRCFSVKQLERITLSGELSKSRTS